MSATESIYDRTKWGLPMPYSELVIERLDWNIDHRAIDALGLSAHEEWKPGHDVLELPMLMKILFDNQKDVKLLFNRKGVMCGELAYVVSRFPRAFEMIEGFGKDAVMLDLYAENARSEDIGFEGIAWALAWMQAGHLTNAGLGLFIRQSRARGLGFDDVVPYLTNGFMDLDIIRGGMGHDIDIELFKSLKEGADD